jgi:hypothetical protein
MLMVQSVPEEVGTRKWSEPSTSLLLQPKMEISELYKQKLQKSMFTVTFRNASKSFFGVVF